MAWYGRIDGEVNDRTARWPLDVAGEIKGAVLGLYGGKDQGIPLDDVESMKGALAKAGGKSQIHVYAGSGPCLPCRLSPDLPQGRGGGRLAAPAGLVQAARGVTPPSPCWRRTGLRRPASADFFRVGQWRIPDTKAYKHRVSYCPLSSVSGVT